MRSKNAQTGKNHSMGKTFDKAGASSLLLLLAFLLFYRVTKSLWIAIVAAALTFLTAILFLSLLRPRAPKDFLSKRNFVRYVLLWGNGTLRQAVHAALAGRYDAQEVGDHTLLTQGNERILVYYAYKFGSLSEDDVAKSFRIAEKHGCESIYALTNHLDRKAMAVAEYVKENYTVINASTLYKFLLKKGLIPKKDALRRKSGKAFDLLKTFLKAENAKYYVWAGLATALLALFTPITAYYLAFSFLNLALATAAILFSEKNDGRNELFRE